MGNLILDIIFNEFLYYLSEIFKGFYKIYKVSKGIPPDWRTILKNKVNFYRNLTPEQQKHFEKRIIKFLIDYPIKPVQTEVTELDKILIASSAIIPVFSFKNWYYPNLKTIYLFEDDFSIIHPLIEKGTKMKGLVGLGKMKGKMYLSKKALHYSFENDYDKKHTAIHEFLHIIDMEDGDADGIPESLLKRPYIIPWKNLVEKEIEKICQNNSVLSEYACTNAAEFFAEAGVHFFENPEELRDKNPELYDMLSMIFEQNPAQKKKNL